MQEILHRRINAVAVGRAEQRDLSAAPDFRDQVRNVRAGHIVNADLAAFCLQLRGGGLRGARRVAVQVSRYQEDL